MKIQQKGDFATMGAKLNEEKPKFIVHTYCDGLFIFTGDFSGSTNRLIESLKMTNDVYDIRNNADMDYQLGLVVDDYNNEELDKSTLRIILLNDNRALKTCSEKLDYFFTKYIYNNFDEKQKTLLRSLFGGISPYGD